MKRIFILSILSLLLFEVEAQEFPIGTNVRIYGYLVVDGDSIKTSYFVVDSIKVNDSLIVKIYQGVIPDTTEVAKMINDRSLEVAGSNTDIQLNYNELLGSSDDVLSGSLFTFDGDRLYIQEPSHSNYFDFDLDPSNLGIELYAEESDYDYIYMKQNADEFQLFCDESSQSDGVIFDLDSDGSNYSNPMYRLNVFNGSNELSIRYYISPSPVYQVGHYTGSELDYLRIYNDKTTLGFNSIDFFQLDTDSLWISDIPISGFSALVGGQFSGSLTDGVPTEAEIEAIIGTTAAGAKAGYKVTIKDTDGSGLLYQVESDGTDWFYVVMTKAL